MYCYCVFIFVCVISWYFMCSIYTVKYEIYCLFILGFSLFSSTPDIYVSAVVTTVYTPLLTAEGTC